MRGNWKLATDANIETYHVNTVHKELSAVLDQKATTIWLLQTAIPECSTFTAPDRSKCRGAPFARVNPVTGGGVYAYHLTEYRDGDFADPDFHYPGMAAGSGGIRYDAYYLMAEPLNDRNRHSYERMIAATEKILKRIWAISPLCRNRSRREPSSISR